MLVFTHYLKLVCYNHLLYQAVNPVITHSNQGVVSQDVSSSLICCLFLCSDMLLFCLLLNLLTLSTVSTLILLLNQSSLASLYLRLCLLFIHPPLFTYNVYIKCNNKCNIGTHSLLLFLGHLDYISYLISTQQFNHLHK